VAFRAALAAGRLLGGHSEGPHASRALWAEACSRAHTSTDRTSVISPSLGQCVAWYRLRSLRADPFVHRSAWAGTAC